MRSTIKPPSHGVQGANESDEHTHVTSLTEVIIRHQQTVEKSKGIQTFREEQ